MVSTTQDDSMHRADGAGGAGGGAGGGVGGETGFESGGGVIGSGPLTRMDTHVHSKASDGPALAALGMINCPECYSEPERIYDMAMARGMDLVTITDHDTIKGALELHERGFQNFVIGQEFTVYFPEDRCKLHVLIWGLTPALNEQLHGHGLANDVYALARFLRDHQLAHSLAHPLYVQNGRLTRWHIERATLLFRSFETLNGAHSATLCDPIELYLRTLTPALVQELTRVHGIEPLWPRPWLKGRTAGSDDHGLLNIGRSWTGVRSDTGEKITDPAEFLRRAMAGRSEVGGIAGHSSLLAHQFTTVGAHYYAKNLHDLPSPTGRLLASKLLRFAGIEVERPSKPRLVAHVLKNKVFKRKKRSLPIVRALRASIGPALEQFPEIRARLSPETWQDGAPLADHDRMAEFMDSLSASVSHALSSSVVRSVKKRDRNALGDHLLSYAILQAAQVPYIYSLFHQNKERNFVERFAHEIAPPGSGASPLERPMRVSLFTDTLGDVNGVCRFIENVAHQANVTGRDLHVITSTRFTCPDYPNVFNFDPAVAFKMPKYDKLEVCLPPITRILRHLDRHQPDVLHISTPGPVGMLGYLAAKMLRIPVLGVYHTDFPAYVDRLFDDHVFTRATEKYMRAFYKPFSAIFTRSEDYVESLVRLGMERQRVMSLLPGFETDTFNVSFKDRSIWERLGCSPTALKVLFVGRVSVEKNMPFLTQLWKQVCHRNKELGIDAELIVVGDGPYRERMQQELKHLPARFLGFRHARELSTIYASSDMFVFPSVTDTLGQVVLESQGSGLPVVVTDQGGPKEVVVEGVTGHVLSVERPNDWVERICGILADDERRARMSHAAHASVQRYSLANSFEHFWETHTRAWHQHLSTQGIVPRTDPRPAPAMPPVVVTPLTRAGTGVTG
jgi:glycosyltransferase involved in cell wall biosynthesis